MCIVHTLRVTHHTRNVVHHLKTTTIHTTKKLEKQIKKRIQPGDSHSTSLLGKWNANLFYVNRKKCWLVSNGLTKYTVILTDMNAKKLLNAEDIFKNTFHDQLIYDGVLIEFEEVENLIGEIMFKPTDNDRVTGGFQNQRIQEFEWWQYEYDSLADMPIRDINNRMNTTPIHIGPSKRMSDYTTSVEEIKKTVYNSK